jgi:uncharacterized protein DUF1844
MAERDQEEGFKVTDRRRRDDDAQPAPTAARPAEASVSTTEAASRRDEPRATAPDEVNPPTSGVPERSLAGLFMMLASEAAIAMGDTPDPVTGQRHRELDHAAGVIDLLMLLREKTEGNRSPEETQVIDELLYDLQLRYVNATKRSG